jgi:hypothetical protein
VFDCLYCSITKAPSDSSLEHAIPQFLGGDAAPKRFHLTNVCKRCNNVLGLFVDAAYAKAWATSNALTNAAHVLCASKNDPGLPLSYIGHARISGLAVPEGHVAEHWIGPFGETVVWVRAHDDRMDVYAGGNPIDAKRKPSVAYFFPTRTDEVGLQLGLSSLERMFKKKDVHKIFGAKVVDEIGNEVTSSPPGFVLPDSVETVALEAIRVQLDSGTMHARAGMALNFDHRFICKLALGIGYGLFGEAFLQEPSTHDLRRGLWPSQDEPKPKVRGTPTFASEDPAITKITHYPGAVVLWVQRSADHWSLTLTLDPKLTFTVAMAPATLTSNEIDLNEAYALVLIPYLEQAFEMTGAEMIAHRLGSIPHPQLEVIDERRRNAKVFRTQLLAAGVP